MFDDRMNKEKFGSFCLTLKRKNVIFVRQHFVDVESSRKVEFSLTLPAIRKHIERYMKWLARTEKVIKIINYIL
ncbi:hypothetical protein FJZ31_27880 [Candidatus Poribacteria bacterium]|nr:hypothetical protein [Candidatus Poribacteria bacterium]